jgi:hypothetical protein
MGCPPLSHLQILFPPSPPTSVPGPRNHESPSPLSPPIAGPNGGPSMVESRAKDEVFLALSSTEVVEIPPPKKEYLLRYRYKGKEDSSSSTCLSLDPVQPNPVGRKSHLLKSNNSSYGHSQR